MGSQWGIYGLLFLTLAVFVQRVWSLIECGRSFVALLAFS